MATQALTAAAGISDQSRRNLALGNLARELAAAGRIEQSLQAAIRIDRRAARNKMLDDMAQALAKAGHAEQALQAAEAIDDPETKARVAAALLSGSLGPSNSSPAVYRALKLLLFTSSASEFLPALPPALLRRRLVTSGDL